MGNRRSCSHRWWPKDGNVRLSLRANFHFAKLSLFFSSLTDIMPQCTLFFNLQPYFTDTYYNWKIVHSHNFAPILFSCIFKKSAFSLLILILSNKFTKFWDFVYFFQTQVPVVKELKGVEVRGTTVSSLGWGGNSSSSSVTIMLRRVFLIL